MDGMFPKFGAVFAQFEFFSSRLSSDGVVIFPSFFTDEKDCFRLLFSFFTFCHARSPDNVERPIITEALPLTRPQSPSSLCPLCLCGEEKKINHKEQMGSRLTRCGIITVH